MQKPSAPDILWFSELGLGDVGRVGGKTASLGELLRELTPLGVRVPDGFAVTADAYRRFLRGSGLEERLAARLRGLDATDVACLQQTGREIRRAILETPLPPALETLVVAAYRRLGAGDVAVRSSATAEDLPEASFAGQQESYLNVHGEGALLQSVRSCFASLFTDRAIAYRAERGYGHLDVALSVAVQRMVRSDLGAAGVMFTIDTETGCPEVVLINAAYGLGETVVQGSVNPDEFVVFKPGLREGRRPILRRSLGTKEFKLVYDEGGGRRTKPVPVPAEERARFAIGDEDVLVLARWALLVEEHYGRKAGRRMPMDLEWAKDGRTGELHLLQARPETVQSRRRPDVLERHVLKGKGAVRVEGRAVGEKIAVGPVRVLRELSKLSEFRPGEVLVAEKTDPDWEPVLRKAAAVVTDRGGRTCHAAIVSRELGLPAVVGTGRGTEELRDGEEVTVSCAEGETGRVYAGRLDFEVERTDLAELPRPRTKIMMNVADPGKAFRFAMLPNDGVGLARMEFIVAEQIRAHPMALLRPGEIRDPAERAEIERLTTGRADKGEYFVERLAEGVGTIAAAFHPRDVIVRLSDFKTNEYAKLLGGAAFEPAEENPMLGFRGASRYTHPRYAEGFALECRALRRVREDMGLRNLKIMIPFCRTVEEGRKVLAEMEKHGLKRGVDGLEVYVMCEIPSNVILAEQFAELFDGFSIGSNDLTQLTLGVDRDSEIVAPLFDERNPAVTTLIRQVIRTARAKGRKIGICGQAPSDYPDFARFLVEEGIDSISLNPDSVLRTTLAVLAAERG
jgi:pyruvate,water dikinase